MSSLTIPRAAELRPPRRGAGGRRYIGPKVQVNIPEEQYDFVLAYMEEKGYSEEQYPDALREVFAAGVDCLRTAVIRESAGRLSRAAAGGA